MGSQEAAIMCDDEIHQFEGTIRVAETPLSRRTFGLSAVAAASLSAGLAQAADAKVVEKDADIKTADGTADAALFYPDGKGKWPARLVWAHIPGLRPGCPDSGRRLAAPSYRR